MKLPKCPKCGCDVRKDSIAASGQQRWRCGFQIKHTRPIRYHSGCGWHGTEPLGIDKAKSAGVLRRHADALHSKLAKSKGTRRYVITAAQNATPIHKPFFASLLAYCKINDAQLIVIPYRYRNPTSMWTEHNRDDDWWAPELTSYLMDKRVKLHKHLVLLADIKTQPTAGAPLRGFETLTGPESAIIGHPKIELVMVPTPQHRMPKILTTTGSVTEKNYIPSKTGKKGEHHHSFGACVVELEDNLYHIRQINAVKDGSFCDLNLEYTAEGSRPIVVEGLAMGDTHVEFVDPDVVETTFGKDGIVPTLKPRQIVWHDVHDGYSVNHHHRKEVFTLFAKHHSGKNNAEAELDRTFAFIDEHTSKNVVNVFPSSNHPSWLGRWVKETDPRSDPENAVFWAYTFVAMCEASRMTATGASTIDPFVFWAERKLKTFKQARFLRTDDSYQIAGIEVGMHGHLGLNGGRGSIRSFGKIGTKSVIGHSHTPGICNGVYQVGTMSYLRLDYNSGPSSWLHTHCLIYPNGKRTLINIVDRKWKASDQK